MRALLILCVGAGLAAPAAVAQTRPAHQAGKPAARPANPAKSIGKFEDWQAATHVEAGQTVCYAFVRAQSSAPPLPGRGEVVLTVTHRPGMPVAVAVTAGFAYAPNAEVQMAIDRAELPFYTGGRSAFARDGKAVIASFERARQAVVKSPGPKTAVVTDTFSLRGFAPAYAAINKACTVK